MRLLTLRMIYALAAFLSVQFNVQSQVYCTGDTPFFSVDLSGNPSGTWISPAVVRDGSCCGGGANQVNCVEMAITLDSSAIGINFSVFSGANPGGALYFQINCQDVPMPTSDAPICLNGPGPHYISYCKVGNNTNQYAITSVPGPATTADVTTAEGCAQALGITGVDPASVTWNSISPGTSGQYNNYLSNMSGTVNGISGTPFAGYSDVNVTPVSGSPASIQYVVCGNVITPCLSQTYCDTVTVTVLQALDVAISPAAPYLCYGQSFVTLTANHTGGQAPYSYLWSNGQTTPSINVTSGGVYSVTVTDATGCPIATDQVTVVQFTQPISANAGPDLTVCSATSSSIAINGSVTGVTTGIWSGGTGTYTSSNTDLTLNYTLSAAEIVSGSVTLTLTTTNTGTCPASADQLTITVSELTATLVNVQPVSCFGGSNGSILVSATGGITPYTYSLNGGIPQLSNSFTGLPAGNYSVVVSDNTGCSGTVTTTIIQPPQLTFSSIPQNVSCFGSCDGQITVSASGGTSPYTYSSDNGTTYGAANVLGNLCAGTISVVVQDNNGCLTNANVAITEPVALSAGFALTNPVCAGSCDGQIGVIVSGGTPSYQYSVDGGALQAGNVMTGLCAGPHTLIVQDGNGCLLNAVQALINPPSFGIDLISMSPSNCGFNNGAIEIAANGTNGPFLYSMDGGPDQPSGIFTNLLAGAYSFVATDTLGCQAQVFFGVNDVEMDGILIDQGDVTCFGGNDGWVSVTNSAGANPITFDLDNGGVTQTNGTFFGLDAGSHIVTIYDAGLCVFTIPFTVQQPDQIQFTTGSNSVTCYGGANGTIVVTTTSGGTGAYQYSLDGVNFQSGNVFTGLTAGNYTVFVTDANNCLVSGAVTVLQPTQVTFSVNSTDLTCFANNSGVIQLSGSGGNGNFMYSIDNGATFQSNQSFLGLASGTYNIVVQDITGCPATGSSTLTEPALLSATYTPQSVTCFGSCDGEIAVAAGGGTIPYMYSSDNGVTQSTNPLLTGLCQGNYTVLVTDDNGCTITALIAVGTPPALTVSVSSTPSVCDLPNGSVTVNAGGGTPGYTFSTDNVNFSVANTFGGLAAGMYTLYVQDSQGCVASTAEIVTAQPSPVITGVDLIPVSCFGVCDATITISSSGGTGTVQYSIGGAYQPAGTFTDLCAGTYTLTVSDSNGCVTDYGVPFVISEPALLTFSATGGDLTCYDNGTGVISFAAQGGIPDYQYSINGGNTFNSSPQYTLLDAGTYNLAVSDLNGCMATGQVILNQPSQLEITNLATTDALCADSCNGTAEVFAQGGTVTSVYSYNWYTVSVNTDTSQISGLCEGVYTSVVLDDNGCYDTAHFTINEPLPMIIDSVTAYSPLCNGACNGIISLWSSDASLYSFDGGITFGSQNTINTLCEGSYNVVVQSPLGCQASIDEVILTDPPVLSVVAGPDSVLCPGTPGILQAMAIGGTPPYTYYWDDQEEGPIQIVVPVTTTSYNVYVQDGNGCLTTEDSTLLALYENLTIVVSNDTIICPGTEAGLAVNVLSGVPGFSYSWYQNGFQIADDQNITVSPYNTAEYVVETNDQCSVVFDTVLVETFVVPEVTFGVTEQQACAPMAVELFLTMGASLPGGNCIWTFSDGTVVNGCDTITEVFTDPGCYSVTFTGESQNGCMMSGFGENVFCVVENPVADFFFNPSVPTYLAPDVQFYNTSLYADSYNWAFTGYAGSDEVNPSVSFISTDIEDTIWVCLTASNFNGCTDVHCEPVVIEDAFTIYVPNAFTPDNDEFNQGFGPVFPEGFDLRNYELIIFDRWGEILFESRNPEIGWDGSYSGKTAQDGVYTWKINVRDGNTNKQYSLVGHVSLLR